MSEERRELLDDFLVDMDIETITLDKNDERVFLETEELDEEELEAANDLSKSSGVEIENLNISGGLAPSEASEIKAETINIYQQSPVVNLSGEEIKQTREEVNQSIPTPQSVLPQGGAPQGLGAVYEQVGAVQQTQSQVIPQPQNITFENVTFEIKDANIKIEKGDTYTEDTSFKTDEIKVEDVKDLITQPEEELITVSEADLNEIIDENTVDLDKLAEETESEFASLDETLSDVGIDSEFEEKEELKNTIDEIEKVEEPSIPQEEEITPIEPEKIEREEKEETMGLKEEDSIVSIDGSELDNLIYGSEISKYIEEQPEVMEEAPSNIEFTQKEAEPVEVMETTKTTENMEVPEVEIPTKNLVESSENLEIEDFSGFDNLEEIKLDDVPLENLEIQTEGLTEVPIVEESKEESVEEEPIVAIEEEKEEELISPQALSEEGKEEDFTFDLSVIPDVAEVEEDEPIALSLEELNNIEVSEEKEIEPEVEESENVEVSMEEFSTGSELEDNIKSPSSIELYGTDEEGGLPEGLEIEGIDHILEEPELGKSYSESVGAIQDKIESLSPETKEELRTVLKYLDNLLEELPEDKIKEFAKSEYYDLYVKILDKLGV